MMVLHRNDADGVQWSVHYPSPFICAHVHDLLPTWQEPLASVVLVLQRCSVSLVNRTADTERQKDILRDRFIYLGFAIINRLAAEGYDAEIFDPKSGFPFRLPSGSMKLDDVAIAHRALGYPINNQGSCRYLVHPEWSNAVYPSTIVSSAPVSVVEQILRSLSGSEYSPDRSRHPGTYHNHGFYRALNGLVLSIKPSIVRPPLGQEPESRSQNSGGSWLLAPVS